MKWQAGESMEITKEQLIQEIRNASFNSLSNFLKLLGYDSSLFKHLYDIPISIGDTNDEASGQYIPESNLIILNSKMIDDLLKYVNQADDEKMKNRAILNGAVTLVHEIIHANRVIIIENGLSSTNLLEKADMESFQYIQQQEHDLERYRDLLSHMLSKSYVTDFARFIPIKIRLNDDGTYTIIAYNTSTNNYNEFADQRFTATMKEDLDEFIYQIGLELNSKESKHQITSIIYSGIDTNKQILLASDYYHPYSNKGKIVSQSDSASEILSPVQYSHALKREINHITQHLENSNGFEETLAETLADIIIMSRSSQTLDLDSVTSKIINSKSAPIDEKAMATLICKTGINMLKWFMISTYTDHYEDKFEKIFEEEYDSLLYSFNRLYNNELYGNAKSSSSITARNNIEQILDKKVGKAP